MKICNRCGPPAKPLKEFYKNRRNPDGRSYWCIECTKEYARTVYHEQKPPPEVTMAVGNRAGDPVTNLPIGQVPSENKLFAELDAAILRARAEAEASEKRLQLRREEMGLSTPDEWRA